MWMPKSLAIYDLFPFIQKLHIFSLDKISVNGVINALFWTCTIFGIVYYYFSKILLILQKSHKINQYKWHSTIRYGWNISFYAASVFCLYLYHRYFIALRLERETGRLFSKYENALFLYSDNSPMFDSISLILTTFYITSAILDLHARDYSEASTKCFYICLLGSFDSYGYEHFSIILNIVMGIFNLFTECLMTASLHTPKKSIGLFRIFLFLKIISWAYVYLTLLPFKYLIPTLYAKKFKLWLNVFLWFWYGSCVWNSPILQYFYHQIYHVNNSNECTGNDSISRCILLKDTPDLRHYKNLQKAVIEIKLANILNNKEIPAETSENSSAKIFQTIKCMMTLKRKLRRIRENKDSPDLNVPNNSTEY